MQIPAKKFIDLLESQQLLSDDIVEELRRQVAESRTKLSPELLAKLLVDNGHLTKFQATKLVAEFSQPVAGNERVADADEELGLASEEDEQTSRQPANVVAQVFIDDEDIAEVEALDGDEVDVDVVEVVEVESVAAEPVEVVEVVEAAEPFVAERSPVSMASSSSAVAPSRPYKGKVAKANPWDSFRILGVGIIFALVCIAGFFLVRFFMRGNADDWLQRADSNYEKRSYETAAGVYEEFPENFPTHEKVSYAKVRRALSLLRKEVEGAPDPANGLKVALEVLPPIAEESSMAEQQSDLAGALVSLAQKFNDRADSRKDTAERKALMANMDKLMELINNPQFVGANQRSQQAPSLARIEEDRQRILREINRDEELAVALGEIDEQLSAKDTIAAYAVREALINRYPLLEANESLIERTRQATEIQQSLVADGQLDIKLAKEEPSTEVGRSFVLANRSGKTAPTLAGRVAFAKVKGGVYALDASTGDVVWRKYVGRGFDSYPIRLGESAKADALIAQPEVGKVLRVDGSSGQTKWVATVGEPILTPTVESQDLFVATYSGLLASLDEGSGQSKWVRKLPQPIEVAPGVAFGKPNLYVPGEHSNLYVLDRRSGECKEVYYLGHRSGSIAVPPILLLGQLFIFENINNESARIRTLSTSDDGLDLKPAQNSITVDGNIVVSPQVDRRRLIVQSDLGQIIVLDVEPTAETQKVTTIATVPKNLLEPQVSWCVAGDNKVWLADSRFTRFDLQVSLQKLNRAWIKNDGDQFSGPPQLIDNVIIHTRTLRGNSGVRVAAVEAESGEPIWQTDLGVPVALVKNTGERAYEAVNSSGSLFALDNMPIRNAADVDPAQGKPAMMFANPVWLSDKSAVMLNQSKSNQMAIYSPQSLRLLSANFGSARPSCPATAVGDNLAVGLDNGQMVLIDPSNGTMAAAPYQPPMQPGKKVRWNQALLLGETLIVSSDLQKLVRLGIGDSLSVLTEVDLESPLSGPLAALGKQVCGVQASPAGDSLVVFDSTSLKKLGNVALDGRLVSGPFPHAGGVILQTNTKLMGISAEAAVSWSIDFPNSQLISAPAAMGGNLVCVTRAGQVWVVDASNGNVIGDMDAGQALSSTPLLLPTTLLVGSDEGAVLALPIPTTRMENR